MRIKDIKLLELELFSYCNRQCDWCPNKYIDRISENKNISNIILNNLLEELREKKFRGVISFSRYNEPLSSFPTLYEKIQTIKSYLPKVKLVSNTNGDFIEDYLLNDKKIIDELSIMDYDCLGQNYWKNKLEFFGAKLIHYNQKNETLLMQLNDKKLLVCCNWPRHAIIENRASSLDNKDIMRYNNNIGKIRDFPCFEPSYFVGINYDGTVSPCCHFRNDIKSHKDFILGDLNIDSLEHILNQEKAIKFRENCAKNNFNNYPCNTCFKIPGRYTRKKPGILF